MPTEPSPARLATDVNDAALHRPAPMHVGIDHAGHQGGVAEVDDTGARRDLRTCTDSGDLAVLHHYHAVIGEVARTDAIPTTLRRWILNALSGPCRRLTPRLRARIATTA